MPVKILSYEPFYVYSSCSCEHGSRLNRCYMFLFYHYLFNDALRS
jgi:hypothetical protein